MSKKEIEPFPTLKAYNNAMHLLGCCVTAVEKYEKEGDMLTPSCVEDITDILLDRFALARDEFNEWDDSIDYEKIAHTMLAQATFDMLASGRYHLYAGILNPLNCSANLMLVYDKAMSYGVRIGMVTPSEKIEQHQYLLKLNYFLSHLYIKKRESKATAFSLFHFLLPPMSSTIQLFIIAGHGFG